MKLLLTGASSYVGARLYFDLRKEFDIVGTYFGNRLSDNFIFLDVTNENEVKHVLTTEKPDIVIHAAANANSRWCETNPQEAIALNQESTKYVVEAANEIGAKVILISSFAAINPENVYGRTKKQSEEIVSQAKKGFVILRPSLIVGFSPNITNDRPFNRILKNLDEKSEAVYDTSWKFQPTYLRHISEVIISVIEKEILNEVIPVTVPEVKSRFDLAHDILSYFGMKVIPIDKHDTSQITRDNLEKLKNLGLPNYSYKQMIMCIIDEIKVRELYRLNE